MNKYHYIISFMAGVFFMALGGCEESTINYSHAKHSERGLKDCNTCHAYSEDLTPKWPKMAKCLTCHIKNYDTNHPESCLLCHTRPGATINVRHNIPKKYRDLKFAHKIHLENKVECNQCHEHIEESNDVTPPGLIPDMFGNCVPCHKKRGAEKLACSVCHKNIKNNRMPLYHEDRWVKHEDPRWIQRHGSEFYYNQDYCKRCHNDLDWCVNCHQEQKPKSHNNAWRGKTHGFAASWERKKCSACHQEDFCERCHSSTKPANHTASWSGAKHGSTALWESKNCRVCHQEDFCVHCHTSTRPSNHTAVWGGKGTANRHCLNCHLPVPAFTCAICHTNTEHPSAPDTVHKNGDYSSQRGCTTCHDKGRGSSPHDNPRLVGVECKVCHKE
ncbi:MAG: hypothetical protein AABZ13_09815 [Planctomycetota bacterium]